MKEQLGYDFITKVDSNFSPPTSLIQATKEILENANPKDLTSEHENSLLDDDPYSALENG